jgi:retron-type reverse transcriptase
MVRLNLSGKYKARLRITELTAGGTTIANNKKETVTATLSSTDWTPISVQYRKQTAADQIIMSGYSTDITTTNGGYLIFDDCRLSVVL